MGEKYRIPTKEYVDNKIVESESLIKGVGWTTEETLAGHGERVSLLENSTEEIDERIDNLIIESGTSDAEVIDARLSGITGVLYTLLKNRLDTMESRALVFNESDIPIATIKFRMSGNQPQLVTEEL